MIELSTASAIADLHLLYVRAMVRKHPSSGRSHSVCMTKYNYCTVTNRHKIVWSGKSGLHCCTTLP
ncbi:hypothetical protein [Nostoc sp.]|uniref:hypothetical protein n=1 Tax=Nostoc sp. TaxID=1180 RepID=UPI002FF88BDC